MMIRDLLRHHIPSMFHRRLLLLVMLAGVVAAVLGAQTARLTLGSNHRQSLAAVEGALSERRLIETVRGDVYDRHGRVLARDEPAYDVAVDFRVISGEWAYQRAFEDARRAHFRQWPELSPAEREALVDQRQAAYDRQAERMWQTLADLGRTERFEIEQRKAQIVRRVHQVASHLHATWRQQRSLELGEPVSLAEVAQPIAEQRQAHSILEDVDESTRLTVQGFRAEAREDPGLAVWRHVELRRPKQRRYPHEKTTVTLDREHLPAPLRAAEPMTLELWGVGAHLVGDMRGVRREDIRGPDGRPFDRDRDLGGYLDGDRVGRFGVEASLERRLRGTRGLEVRYLDTGRTRRIEPEPGEDVRLTIDIELQARIRGIMSPEFGLMQRQPWHDVSDPDLLGEPLRGAAVVLEIDTGEVLAAVSMPARPLDSDAREANEIYGDSRIARSYVNRVVSQPYEPGSTVKPMVLVAAASAGIHPVDEPIVCDGHLFPNDPNSFRCWIFRQYESTHGPLEGPEAIARSCNVYFYALGRDLGVAGLSGWYERFGLGAAPGSGLGREARGNLPNPHGGGRSYSFRDAALMGIGQGPMRWTPIQAVDAYATLVRGGEAMAPTFVQDEHRAEPRRQASLAFNGTAVARALQGLDETVNARYGTGRHLNFPSLDEYESELLFNVEDVSVWGKSGTAQAAPLRIDTTGDGRITAADEIVQRGNHGWFVALPAPEGASEPTHVVAVVVEYGGSGSQVAGPVTNQIIHALKQEGYL